jgi:hypothetical protein
MASKERWKAGFQGCREKPKGCKGPIYYTCDTPKKFGSLGIGTADYPAKSRIS